MADNKRKKKADGKRVALTQQHERAYLVEQLKEITLKLNVVLNYAGIAYQSAARLERRLRAGFPKAKRRRK